MTTCRWKIKEEGANKIKLFKMLAGAFALGHETTEGDVRKGESCNIKLA